ncbi:hypothetical protein EJ110_NYTH06027 [Nymphaea thermarum]|nr:hypothetical protein EJ110_NYTH06027 [Nymphaea thermarum]
MINLAGNLSEPSYGKQIHSFFVKIANSSAFCAVQSSVRIPSLEIWMMQLDCLVKRVRRTWFPLMQWYQQHTFEMKNCSRVSNFPWKWIFMAESLSVLLANNLLYSVHNDVAEKTLEVSIDMAQSGVPQTNHTYRSIFCASASLKNIMLAKSVRA